jgi:hypothetical protein
MFNTKRADKYKHEKGCVKEDEPCGIQFKDDPDAIAKSYRECFFDEPLRLGIPDALELGIERARKCAIMRINDWIGFITEAEETYHKEYVYKKAKSEICEFIWNLVDKRHFDKKDFDWNGKIDENMWDQTYVDIRDRVLQKYIQHYNNTYNTIESFMDRFHAENVQLMMKRLDVAYESFNYAMNRVAKSLDRYIMYSNMSNDRKNDFRKKKPGERNYYWMRSMEKISESFKKYEKEDVYSGQGLRDDIIRAENHKHPVEVCLYLLEEFDPYYDTDIISLFHVVFIENYTSFLTLKQSLFLKFGW